MAWRARRYWQRRDVPLRSSSGAMRSAARPSAKPRFGPATRSRRRRTFAACSIRGSSTSSTFCARGLSYYRKDPYAFTPLLDGRSLLLGTDRASNAREIAAFDRATSPASTRTSSGPTAWVARSSIRFPTTIRVSSASIPRRSRCCAAPRPTLVERYISTPVLQAELVNDGLIGTNLGPRDAGTAYVLAHHLAGRLLGAQGAWAFVRGGMGSVSARARVGGAMRTAPRFSPTRPLRGSSSTTTRVGVRHLALDGAPWRCGRRMVASNAHPRTTFLDLLDPSILETEFVRR